MDTEVFLKAVNNAKQNPEDPNSVEFVNRIQQGKYNNYLKHLGKPTFENGQMVQPSTMDKVTNRVQQGIEHPIETVKGALKGAARTVVGTASGLQDLGQYGMGQVESAVTGKPLEETTAMQPGVGIDALKEETPQGQALQESLAPSNEAQAFGGNVETGAEVFYGGGKELLKGGLNLAKKGLTAAAETPTGAKAIKMTEDLVDVAKTKLSKRATSKTIDAVNPDLSGKKLTEGYKQIVTQGRDAKTAGIFSEQALSPSERAVAIGKRLSTEETLSSGEVMKAIKLNPSNPIKSLKTLSDELKTTESQLQTALNSNIEIAASKPVLYTSFEDAAKVAPEEFRIGDASRMYKSVFKFAKKVADASDDSINGLREARSAFDAQAKTQYPSAFKDGAIDTRTAAGAAIKKARDIFNEHLYNTAPNGSDIQKLIGREADIYNATESLAAKAAKSEGKTKIQKVGDVLKEHPIMTTGAAGYGTYEIGKKLFGQ